MVANTVATIYLEAKVNFTSKWSEILVCGLEWGNVFEFEHYFISSFH